MNETCQQAQDFLNAIFSSARFDLVAKADEGEECLLNLDGEDAPLLRNENGELLEAFEQIVNKAFSKSLSGDQRIVCDVQNFRAKHHTAQ
jgi:predicted RNA-binding protein Jag